MRSTNSASRVDGQWITAKKDYQEAKKRYKQQTETRSTESPPPPMADVEGVPNTNSNPNSGVYDKDMDAMRCILYLHGGGYYFGSVDQERFVCMCYPLRMFLIFEQI